MLQQMKSQLSTDDLLKGKFGVEREALRVQLDGTLALTKHSKAFGDKLSNPYIKTDFSESQIEMITPPQENLEGTHKFLTMLYHLVASELQDERLWPQSMPCVLTENQEIPIAMYANHEQGIKEMNYRKLLLNKYGGKRQLISGIHYNFSFSPSLIEKLYLNSNQGVDIKTFKNQIHLKVARNYLRYRWLLVYFLGASPLVDKSYCKKLNRESFLSIRNTPCGYKNQKNLRVSYENPAAYINSLKVAIEQGLILNPKELYSPIRLKPTNPHDLLNSLLTDGIHYLEIRSIDLNPFEKEGISLEDLNFIHLFTLFLLDVDEPDNENWQLESDKNEVDVAQRGLSGNLKLIKNGEQVDLCQWASEIFDQMSQLNEMFDLQMNAILANKKEQIKHPELTLAAQFTRQIKNQDYVKTNLEWANVHYQSANEQPFIIPGFEDLELSTQILISEAVKKGIKIEVLDRLENFIQFKQGKRTQLVKQATKTALDSYIAVLAMENKEVTKHILKQNGMAVPEGLLFENHQVATKAFKKYHGKSVVVKPKSTNFGEGITILNPLTDKEQWKSALETAFLADQSVLVEEFQFGNEYRFLIIDNELIGVLQRIPANVVGDGVHTVNELVEIKNKSSLRGLEHRRPLEKIRIDDQARYYLQVQGYTINSILPKGEQLFLRENSNISTGGDSLDVTEMIPEPFKEQARLAVRHLGARICGVDMIIEDVTNPESPYSIIELNFNPAIHMHAYPYKGKSRNAASHILKALGFES